MQLGHTLQWALPHFQAYTVLLVRIAGLMSVFPILNSRSIPVTIKTALVTVLGLVLAPVVHLPEPPASAPVVVVGVIGEFLIDYGYIIALAVGIIVVSLIVVTKTRKKEPGEPK